MKTLLSMFEKLHDGEFLLPQAQIGDCGNWKSGRVSAKNKQSPLTRNSSVITGVLL
jgi:hypothetical protein